MRVLAWAPALVLLGLVIGGCSSAKTIFLVNYRNESYSVTIEDRSDRSEAIGARSGVALTSNVWAGGAIKLTLTNSKGAKETMEIESSTMQAMTIKETVVIVEIR